MPARPIHHLPYRPHSHMPPPSTPLKAPISESPELGAALCAAAGGQPLGDSRLGAPAFLLPPLLPYECPNAGVMNQA